MDFKKYERYSIQSDTLHDFIVLYDENGNKIAQIGIIGLLYEIGYKKLE